MIFLDAQATAKATDHSMMTVYLKEDWSALSITLAFPCGETFLSSNSMS